MDFDRVGFDRQVGLRVQRARKAAGMTQEEVAKRVTHWHEVNGGA